MPEMMSLTRVCEPNPTATPTTTGAGDQRGDLHTQRRERHQDGGGRQDDQEHDAQDRQQRPDPAAPACLLRRECGSLVVVTVAGEFGCGGEAPVDRSPAELPEQIGDEQDDDRVHRTDHEAREWRILLCQRDQVEVPTPAQQPDGPSDHQDAHQAVDDHRPGGLRNRLVVAGCFTPEQMQDRQMGGTQEYRRPARSDHRPHQGLGAGHPGNPDQHGQQRADHPAGSRGLRPPESGAGRSPAAPSPIR